MVAVLIVLVGIVLVNLLLINNYNNDKAVEHLRAHAQPRSTKQCAGYVRRAIEAGGCPTFLYPVSACDYEVFMPDLGFDKIPEEEYVPQKGDVVVFSDVPGHINGHMCMYDGRQWISDFKQRSMYCASAYRTHGHHTYWRRPDGMALRRVSLTCYVRPVLCVLSAIVVEAVAEHERERALRIGNNGG